jgi:ferredoxin
MTTRRAFAFIFAFLSFILLLAPRLSLALSSSSSFGKTTRNIATQTLQGVGDSTVDLNRYNLASLEDIEKEWTATVTLKSTENTGGVFLAPKNSREIFVDSVTVVFPSNSGSGIGIVLAEVAGGRDDGLGITLVTNLVPGGAAACADCDILPGDSIAKVSVIRRQKRAMSGVTAGGGGIGEAQQIVSVNTECLSYDATVDAITSLNNMSTSTTQQNEDCDEYFELVLKRLRRKPKVTVNLQYPPSQKEPPVSIEMFAGENIRQGMLVRGVKLNDPLAKRFDTKTGGNCGAGGLCRTCAILVQTGGELLNPQRPAEKTMLRDNPRWRLACKAIVGFGMTEGELNIKVSPNQWDQ